MKRKIYTLVSVAVLLLSLSACSNNNQKSHSSSKSDTTSKTTKKSTSSHEVKKVSGTKTMEMKRLATDNQIVVQRQTISYDGDDYTSIKISLDEPLDEDIKKDASSMDFNQAKDALLKALDEQDFIKQLRQMKGATVNTDVTQDYHIKVEVTFDMKTVNKSELKQVDGLGVDFETLLDYTPLEYLLKLAQAGATKVN